jgi:hypothetical protein
MCPILLHVHRVCMYLPSGKLVRTPKESKGNEETHREARRIMLHGLDIQQFRFIDIGQVVLF